MTNERLETVRMVETLLMQANKIVGDLAEAEASDIERGRGGSDVALGFLDMADNRLHEARQDLQAIIAQVSA